MKAARHGFGPEPIARWGDGIVLLLTALAAAAWFGWWRLGHDAAHADGADFLAGAVSWIRMMSVMMLPVAIPSLRVLVLARVGTARGNRPGQVIGFVLGQLLGYLAVWAMVAVILAFLHARLTAAAGGLPAVGGAANAGGAAGLLLLAGAVQWTRAKQRALSSCRAVPSAGTGGEPAGAQSALTLGLRQGRDCVASCWALMGLMLVGDGMDLRWMAAITAYLVVERVVPRQELVSRSVGALLIVAGLALAAGWMPAGVVAEWCEAATGASGLAV